MFRALGSSLEGRTDAFAVPGCRRGGRTGAAAGGKDCAAVIASAVALARGLGVTTVAKGVESPAQFEALQAAGVDFAQGYLLGQPVPNSELSFESSSPVQKFRDRVISDGTQAA